MEMSKQSSPAAGTTSEDHQNITIQIPDSAFSSLYKSIDIAEELIELSNSKGWKKEQFLQALKIIQSLKRFC